MKNKYAIYVVDDNGWAEGCPDSESVFFGDHGGEFFRHSWVDGAPAFLSEMDLGSNGCVIVAGYQAATALLQTLRASGDWIAPEEINPEGAESRPEYGMRKL